MSSAPRAPSESAENGMKQADENDDTTANLPDGSRMEANDLLELLSNERRRFLWRYLRREDGPVELGEASQQVAAWENDVSIDRVTYDQRKSVYTSLHQFHCPKMDDAGLVEFEKRDSTVRLASDLPDELTVEIEPDTENARETIIGSLAVAGGVILGAWAFELPVFGGLPLSGVLLSLGIGAAAALFVYGLLARAEYGVSLADALSEVDA